MPIDGNVTVLFDTEPFKGGAEIGRLETGAGPEPGWLMESETGGTFSRSVNEETLDLLIFALKEPADIERLRNPVELALVIVTFCESFSSVPELSPARVVVSLSRLVVAA